MYNLNYKCRLCGQTFTVAGGGDERPDAAMPDEALEKTAKRLVMNRSAQLMAVHKCSGPFANCVGVADLQGILPRK